MKQQTFAESFGLQGMRNDVLPQPLPAIAADEESTLDWALPRLCVPLRNEDSRPQFQIRSIVEQVSKYR